MLQLIPEYLAELIHITTDSRNVQEKSVKGFDFLVNSFWPVVAEFLLDRNVHHLESLLRSASEFFSVMRIRDVYPESGFFLSRVLDLTKKKRRGKNKFVVLTFVL